MAKFIDIEDGSSIDLEKATSVLYQLTPNEKWKVIVEMLGGKKHTVGSYDTEVEASDIVERIKTRAGRIILFQVRFANARDY